MATCFRQHCATRITTKLARDAAKRDEQAGDEHALPQLELQVERERRQRDDDGVAVGDDISEEDAGARVGGQRRARPSEGGGHDTTV